MHTPCACTFAGGHVFLIRLWRMYVKNREKQLVFIYQPQKNHLLRLLNMIMHIEKV